MFSFEEKKEIGFKFDRILLLVFCSKGDETSRVWLSICRLDN